MEQIKTSGKTVLALAVILAVALSGALHARQAGAAELQAAPAEQAAQQASIAQAEVKVPKATYYHTGKAVKPYPTVTLAGKRLTPGLDYRVTYKSNTSAGTARLTVTGKGAYRGSKTASFKIAYNIAASKSAKIPATTYTGKAAKPKVSLTYKGKKVKARNYKLTYAKNVNAGTATITVKGRGSFAGTKKVRFRIAKASLAKAALSSIPKQKYTGKAIKPKLAVKLAKRTLTAGKDYRLSYSGNKTFGTAMVTVIGKGNYRGTASEKFTIAEPVVKRQYWTRIGGTTGTKACFLPNDPETIYVGVDHPPKVVFNKTLKVWEGDYAIATDKRTGKVVRKEKQYVLLYGAYVTDHTQGTTITIPDGLAEKLWKADGPEFENIPISYSSLWLGLFDTACMSGAYPTCITDFYRGRGIDVPEWFSRAVYDASMTAPGAPHTQNMPDYVLQ